MKTQVEIIKGPGIKVELDASQIFPHDPGMGTPVLVVLSNGDTCSWNVATNEGETADGTQLTPEQLDWLDNVGPRVETWMAEHGA